MLRPPGSVTAAQNQMCTPEEPFILWRELHCLDAALTEAQADLLDIDATFCSQPSCGEVMIDAHDMRGHLAHLNQIARIVKDLAAVLKSRVGER